MIQYYKVVRTFTSVAYPITIIAYTITTLDHRNTSTTYTITSITTQIQVTPTQIQTSGYTNTDIHTITSITCKVTISRATHNRYSHTIQVLTSTPNSTHLENILNAVADSGRMLRTLTHNVREEERGEI